MSSLSQKLTSLVTAFALVIVSFAAVTHHHDHGSHGSDCGSCSHIHSHSTCSDHGHSHDDLQSLDCCGDGAWQFGPFLPVSQNSSAQADDVAATGDYHCLLCRFLSEHSAEISPTFDAEFHARVAPLAVAITSDTPPRLWSAYLQRGPPVA